MEGWVRSYAVKLMVATLAVAFLCGHAQPVHAQDGKDVKGNVAGTIGLGMLGAEVGLLLTPAFNLQDKWWAWALFPTVFAAGGAVAGALAFDPGNPDPAVTISLLGAGFALAVPAIVGAVALKNKRQNRDRAESESGAVLRLGKVQRRWGVPAISTAQVYSLAEQQRFGFAQRSVLRVPLVSGRF
jgi:peptidoglycan/LPS O-acetylase OafA/YrhL